MNEIILTVFSSFFAGFGLIFGFLLGGWFISSILDRFDK